MASTINAITTGAGGIVTTGDSTGNISLQNNGSTVLATTSAGTAITGTLSASGATTLSSTLAVTGAITATGGIVQGATAAPAFSAYSASTQNPTTQVYTKVIFGTEVFDTNNNFASSTFTPTVAGYYQVSASICMAADTSAVGVALLFYKNGVATISNVGNYITGIATATYVIPSASSLVYMNGTTDYLEVYGFISGTGTLRYFFASAGGYPTVFTGFLARSA